MYKEKILKYLLSSGERFTSGSELGGRLKITRTAIWKHIKALEQEGYPIEAAPSKGYRLSGMPDILLPEDIKRGAKTKIIGKEILFLQETDSTNRGAMDLAVQGAQDGTVLIAETQTGGKGRLGRTWVSPKGNIYMSVILRPKIPPHRAQLITLMGAVAIASALRRFYAVPASIKWPNDILISDKKVTGMLTEMRAEPDRVKHIVLGIGINVNMDLTELPSLLRGISTTLAAEAGKMIDRNCFVQQILAELDRWYLIFLTDTTPILEGWMALNSTIGKRVAVSGSGEMLEGIAEGIDKDGRLILKADNGTVQHLAAGDVTILKGHSRS